MPLTFFEFLLFALATFRLTRLIVFDNITAFLRKPFIQEIEEIDSDGTAITYIETKGNGLRSWIGELLSCYWCTGLWCAICLLFLYYLWPTEISVIIYVLAIAAVAAIIETIVSKWMD